mgnify:CR=1 FL=1
MPDKNVITSNTATLSIYKASILRTFLTQNYVDLLECNRNIKGPFIYEDIEIEILLGCSVGERDVNVSCFTSIYLYTVN